MQSVQVRAMYALMGRKVHPNFGLIRAIQQQNAVIVRPVRTIVVDGETGEILSDDTK